jgi:hypothetical protein
MKCTFINMLRIQIIQTVYPLPQQSSKGCLDFLVYISHEMEMRCKTTGCNIKHQHKKIVRGDKYLPHNCHCLQT